MEKQIPCRYQNCQETFNHRQKRSRHEAKHEEAGDILQAKTYECDCCDPPRSFGSARERRNHKHYEALKHTFKCQKCGETFSSKQNMEVHSDGCSILKRNIKMMEKYRKRKPSASRSPRRSPSPSPSPKKKRDDVVKEDKHLSSDEEDKHSSSDDDPTQKQVKQGERCYQCKVLIQDRGDEWWCNKCGWGLCEVCRPGESLNHVYKCLNQRKTPSERTQKRQ